MKKQKKNNKEFNILDIIALIFTICYILLILPFFAVYYIFNKGSMLDDIYLKRLIKKLVGYV